MKTVYERIVHPGGLDDVSGPSLGPTGCPFLRSVSVLYDSNFVDWGRIVTRPGKSP